MPSWKKVALADVTNTFTSDQIVDGGTTSRLIINSSTHNASVANEARLQLGFGHSGAPDAVGYVKLTENATNSFDGTITIGVPYNNGSGGSATRDALTIRQTGDVTFFQHANFPDNGKALFGASNDLQIYHNGTHSYINEGGTGNLIIYQGSNTAVFSPTAVTINRNATFSGNINIGDDKALSLGASDSSQIFNTGSHLFIRNNTSDQDIIFQVNDGGSTQTEVMRIDASSSSVGIGTDNPRKIFHSYSGSGVNIVGLFESSDNQALIAFRDNTTGDDNHVMIGANGTSFQVSTDNTTALTIDSSQRIGIGTSSPSDYHSLADNLVVASSGDTGISIVSGTSSDGRIFFADGTSGGDESRGHIRYNHDDNSMHLVTNDAGSALTIDSSQRVGIGTTSPSKKLEVDGSYNLGSNAFINYNATYPYTINVENTAGVGNLTFQAGTGSTGFKSKIELQGGNTATDASITLTTADSARMTILNNGKVGIGTNIPDTKLQIRGDFDGSSGFPNTNPNKGLNISKHTGVQSDYGLNDKFGITFTSASNLDTDYAIAGIYGQVSGVSSYVGGNIVFASRLETEATLSEKMIITSDGKVGIGTTSPSELLEVKHASNTNKTRLKIVGGTKGFTLGKTGQAQSYAHLRPMSDGQVMAMRLMPHTSDQDTFLELWGHDYETDTTNFARGMLILKQSDGNAFQIVSDSNGSESVGPIEFIIENGQEPSMSVKADGTVAINKNTDGVTGALTISNNQAAASSSTNEAVQMLFGLSGQADSGVIRVGKDEDYTSVGATSSFMSFYTKADGTTSEVMRFKKHIGLGIGTTNPSEKLHVVGTIKAQHSSDTADYVKMLHDGTDGHLLSNRGQLRLSSQSGIDALKIDSSGNVSLTNNLSLTNGSPVMYMSGSSGDHMRFGWAEGDPDVAYWRFYQNSGLTASITMDAITENTAGGRIEFNSGASEVAMASIGTYGVFLGRDAVGQQTTTELGGFGVLSVNGQRYGNYGWLTFNAPTTNFTASSRGWALTNGYKAHSFAILKSSTASTEPSLTTNGEVDSGTTAPLVINNAGNIGIGTGAPDSSHMLTIKTSLTGGDWILGQQSDGGQGFRILADSGDDAVFELGSASTSDMVVLRADGDSHFMGGNVAIGTKSPDSQFHLHGSTGIRLTDSNQNANEYAEIKYDNAGNTNLYINNDWTNSNALINFQLAGSTKMVVRGDGNIGVGTTSPAHLLHVEGAYSSAWLAKFKNTGATNAYGLQIDTTANTTAGEFSLGVYTGTGTGMFVTSDGKVGIGTTSPSYKLDITGPATENGSTLRLNDVVASKNSKHLLIQRSSSTASIGIAGSQPNDPLWISRSGGYDLMVASGGNVGIGTTQPDKTLHVSSSDNVLTTIESTTTHATVRLIDPDTSNEATLTRVGDNLEIVKDGGNVSIGKDNPTQALDVQGSIISSGVLLAPTYATFIHSFTDDMGTSGHFIPWNSSAETTGNDFSSTSFVVPMNMTLVKLYVRIETISNLGSHTLTATLISKPDGSITNTTVASASKSVNAASSGRNQIFTEANFSNPPNLTKGQMGSIKLKFGSDIGGSTDFFITSVWEMDNNTI